MGEEVALCNEKVVSCNLARFYVRREIAEYYYAKLSSNLRAILLLVENAACVYG